MSGSCSADKIYENECQRRPLGQCRRRYENDVGLNSDIKEVGCEVLDWVNLAHDRIQLRAFVGTVVKCWIS